MQHIKLTLSTIALGFATFAAHAAVPTAVPLGPNASMLVSTSKQVTENVLQLPNLTNGFTFSGITGSFTNSVSTAGDYYADYLFTIGSAADVQTAALTMNNGAGITSFTQRIYTYEGSFYDSASASNASPTLLLGQTSSIPAYGVTFSNIAPTRIAAGTYVLEFRGTNVGIYAGTISVSPVPEPEMFVMMALGLGVIGAIRRKRLSAK